MIKKFVLLFPFYIVTISRIWIEVGLGPGCSRIKYLFLHRKLLLKEAMLAFIVEQKFYFFCWHCMQAFLSLSCSSLPLPKFGIPWQKGWCSLLHLQQNHISLLNFQTLFYFCPGNSYCSGFCFCFFSPRFLYFNEPAFTWILKSLQWWTGAAHTKKLMGKRSNRKF